MADLYDTNTRQLIDDKDLTDLDQGIVDGRYGYKKDARIDVQDREGNAISVSGEELRTAIADHGYRVETPNQYQLRKFKQDPANQGFSGAKNVFLDSMANEIGFGVPDIMRNHNLSDLERAKLGQLRNDHQMASAAGGIVGFLGSLRAGPGGIFYRGTQAIGRAGAEKAVSAAMRQMSKRSALTKGVTDAVAGRAAIIKKATEAGISETAAKEMGKHWGQRVSERALAGGLEGLMDMSPRILTEMAYGDHEAAGEYAAWGFGLGAPFGAFFGKRIPEAHELMKLNKKVQKSITDQPMKAAGISKALETVTGVKGTDWDRMIHNLDDIKLQLKEHGGDPIPARNQMVERLTLLQDQADQAMAQVKARGGWGDREMMDMANDFTEEIRRQRKAISDMSSESFNILEAAEPMIDPAALVKVRASLTKNLQAAQKKMRFYGAEPAGIEKSAAVKGVQRFVDMVDAIPGESMKATDIKRILMDMGDNINWVKIADVAPNPVLNKALGNVRAALNKDLKTLVPEYGRAMDVIAPQTAAVADFARAFRTRDAIDPKKLQRIAGKKGISDEQRQIFDRFVDAAGDMQPYRQRLGQQFRNADAFEGTKQLLADLKPLKKPTGIDQLGGFTENKNMVRLLRRLEEGLEQPVATKGMQELDELYGSLASFRQKNAQGIGVEDQIRNFNAIKRIMSDKTNGFRKAGTGASLGYAAASALDAVSPGVGVGVGAVAGYVADMRLGQIVRTMVNVANKPFDGLLFREANMAKFARSSEALAKEITRRTVRTQKMNKATFTARKALYQYLNVEHGTKGQGELIKDIRARLEEIIENPELFIDYLSEMTFGMREGGAPLMAEEITAKAMQVSQYLLAELPVPPEENVFAAPVKWEPSKMIMKAWEDKAIVALDPSVMDSLARDNAVNRNHMESLRTNYPNIAAELTKAVYEAAAVTEDKLDYQGRMRVSLLTGTQLNPSIANTAYYQSTWGGGGGSEGGGGGGGGGAPSAMPQKGMDAITAGAGSASGNLQTTLNPDAGVPDMTGLQMVPGMTDMPQPEMMGQAPAMPPPIPEAMPPMPPPEAGLEPPGGVVPPAQEFPGPGYVGLPPGGEFLQPPEPEPAPEPPPVEFTEDGDPIIPLPPAPPNLTAGQEVIAFLEMFAGMETLGTGDTITVAGGTILPEQRKAFDEAMAIYPKMPGGKMIRIDFGGKKKIPDELDDSLSKLVDEIRGKETRTGAEDDLLRRYEKVAGEKPDNRPYPYGPGSDDLQKTIAKENDDFYNSLRDAPEKRIRKGTGINKLREMRLNERKIDESDMRIAAKDAYEGIIGDLKVLRSQGKMDFETRDDIQEALGYMAAIRGGVDLSPNQLNALDAFDRKYKFDIESSRHPESGWRMEGRLEGIEKLIDDLVDKGTRTGAEDDLLRRFDKRNPETDLEHAARIKKTKFNKFNVEYKNDSGIHQFTAHNKDGDYAGELQVTNDVTGHEGEWYVLLAQVEKGYRRKGLASFMYDWAEKVLKGKLVGSVDQSPDAVALWKSRNKKGDE